MGDARAHSEEALSLDNSNFDLFFRLKKNCFTCKVGENELSREVGIFFYQISSISDDRAASTAA